MSKIFERDYQMLDLGRDANWQEAQGSYRRLVNRWHPDRFTARPREKQHAQSRFIDITKSYNNLRSFHREHNRLPLQNPSYRDASRPQSTETPPEPTKRPASQDHAQIEDAFATQVQTSPEKKNHLWLWAIPVVGLIGMVILFVELERQTAAKNREAAIEVLRSTEPSEFMPRN